jgi:hypothetical protein
VAFFVYLIHLFIVLIPQELNDWPIGEGVYTPKPCPPSMMQQPKLIAFRTNTQQLIWELGTFSSSSYPFLKKSHAYTRVVYTVSLYVYLIIHCAYL